MKISILTREPSSYSTNRIKQVAKDRGHSLRVIEPNKVALHIEQGHPSVIYKDKPLSFQDVLVPRIGAAHATFAQSVIRQFEQQGTFCLNTSAAVAIAADKLRQMQILSRHRIPIPPTAFVFNRADIGPAIERVGNAPVIIKNLSGQEGSGVILSESKKVAEAIIEALQVANQNVLIQKFVAESRGRDIRAFVVGDRVVASMRRTAQEGEYRSNVHLGASVEAISLTPEQQRIAIHAAQIIGLRIAGVDLLEGKDTLQVMEVNSSPGLEGIERATGIDVAQAIVEFIETQVTFPDLDIKQRLELSKGYRVAEVPVGRGSRLVDKLLGDCGLDQQEIMVLSIIREDITIPYPKTNEIIRKGDRLLCFGKETP
ncbi:MAG: RimK family alpha-L-glutamate ligase, partial [Bdellovibrionales bacterium]|nr:RimK family alpha-L-glutamate ligase [Bdellovibrionales bacterium]